ncbi:hypothetical protein G9A89_008160 [Geosiphon pyriformis]|nr:hypothetical protein G9A89_008160 [Geosiphon pyriformis]
MTTPVSPKIETFQSEGIVSRKCSHQRLGNSEDSKPALETTSAPVDVRPAKKRFTTAKDRREHLEKNFGKKVGPHESYIPGYQGKAWDKKNDSSKNDADQAEASEKEARKPKRKVAVMIGYCGTGYQGLQINPGAKTIEEEIFKAFVAAEAISQDNSKDPKKVGLMRAARTDKGVHAAGNVISLKIRFSKVIKSFHSKTLCDSRRYEYLIPTHVFQHHPLPAVAPNTPSMSMESQLNLTLVSQIETISRSIELELNSKTLNMGSAGAPSSLTSGDSIDHISLEDIPVATVEEMIEKRKYRISSETLEMVSDPMMIKDTEWLSLKVHGQSFMLHQIRKMVSIIVLCVRSETPLSLVAKTFESVCINIPKAPALGLLLESPVFDSYNKKAIELKKNVVDFVQYREKIDNFKEKFIYSQIFDVELSENTFQNWLNIIDYHTARDYGYLNTEGIIPDNAIVVTGQKSQKGKRVVLLDDDDDDSGEGEI